jgi:thiosulfate/3-mercaptopyruvate sulfurtransferase
MAAFGLAMLLLAAGGCEQPKMQSHFSDNRPVGEQPVWYVTTQWLADHHEDANLLILDCQPDVHDYFTGHIPGAVYFPEGLLRCTYNSLPATYVPDENLKNVLEEIGVSNDTRVVVYTGEGRFTESGNGLEQTNVAYSLARFGVKNVYLLDGGLEKWIAEDRPLSQEFPQTATAKFDIDIRRDYFVDIDYVKANKDRPDTVLIDARPPGAYAGRGPWIKAGHIPGAVNVFWKNLMHPGNPRLLRPREEIVAAFAEKGVTPEKQIIVSCGTGREATNEFLILKYYLGYPNVKIYEGSFTEWTSDPANPTVLGPNPR